MDKNSLEARLLRSAALMGQRKFNEARVVLAESLRANPNSSDAHFQLALALSRQGHTPDAINHYRQAIRLQPTLLGAVNNLAWILATHPNPAYRDRPTVRQRQTSPTGSPNTYDG